MEGQSLEVQPFQRMSLALTTFRIAHLNEASRAFALKFPCTTIVPPSCKGYLSSAPKANHDHQDLESLVGDQR